MKSLEEYIDDYLDNYNDLKKQTNFGELNIPRKNSLKKLKK